jgi:hypothetical protein
MLFEKGRLINIKEEKTRYPFSIKSQKGKLT